MENYGNYDFFQNIQVITPTKKGMLGTKELNKTLQKHLNPESDALLEKKVGDFVEEKEVLATIHAADWESAEKAKQEIQKIDRIVSEKVEKQPTILRIVADEK